MTEQSQAGVSCRADPCKLGRDAPAKMAARDIAPQEVRALLGDQVIIDVVAGRDRYVVLGRVAGRPLIAVLAGDELDDATVHVSVYEPHAEHGWTSERSNARCRATPGRNRDDTPPS